MMNLDFKSNNNYLYLPTKSSPKVVLAIDNSTMAKVSFDLYNPFSFKVKCFKKVIAFLFSHLNGFMLYFMPRQNDRKSEFIEYLEKELDKSIVSSIYCSTAGDKNILQLTSNNEIIGFAKVALNEVGKKHLLNEKKAIDILSKENMVSPVLKFDYYQGMPFLIVKKLNGKIEMVKENRIISILDSFKANKKFQLNHHPRILQIGKANEEFGLSYLSNILNKAVNSSNEFYFQVKEHGDFTPWNIVNSEYKCTPFDFEYFEEEGLEYLDLIKYYFQVGRLIKKYKTRKLLMFVSKKVEIIEFDILMRIYLIKEIIIKKMEKQPFDFELQILESIHDGKK